MRMSVEEIVEKAVPNEKLDAEKRVKALMLDYNYEQIGYADIERKLTRMSKQDIIDALATLSVFATPFATLILLKIIL